MKISGVLAPFSLALMIIILLSVYFDDMQPVPAVVFFTLGGFGGVYAAILSSKGK